MTTEYKITNRRKLTPEGFKPIKVEFDITSERQLFAWWALMGAIGGSPMTTPRGDLNPDDLYLALVDRVRELGFDLDTYWSSDAFNVNHIFFKEWGEIEVSEYLSAPTQAPERLSNPIEVTE